MQILCSQVVLPPLTGWGQALAQLPQLLASESRFTQLPLHSVGVVAGHELPHPVAVQTGLLAVHWVVHDRQRAGVVTSVSQPSSGFTVQWAKPVAQAAPGTTHAPAEQVMPVVDPMWESAVQSWPHAPQFLTSLATSTHAPLHNV